MGPLPGAGVFCRGGCGFSRLLAWCFLLVLSPQTPGSRGAEAVWTAYLNVSWRVPHTGVNRTVWELSEEGVYGQDSPLEPVAGVLVPPDGPGALNACNPHTNFTVPTVPGDWGSSVQVSWLALIQRGGGCTFADKIHLAYERGASGAVIFNFPGTRNEVIPMSHPGECSYPIAPQQTPAEAIFSIFLSGYSSPYPLAPKENECPFCPHRVRQGPLFPKLHPAWGVGRENPSEFASGGKG